MPGSANICPCPPPVYIAPLGRELDLFQALCYINISKKKQYFFLTSAGYNLLDRHSISYIRGSKPPNAGSPALRRRLKVSQVALNCLGAGIYATCCLCFGHWGDTTYMLEYAGPDDWGFYMANELGQFSALTSVFTGRMDVSKALILIGENYASIYKSITESTASPRRNKQSYPDLWTVYSLIEHPV